MRALLLLLLICCVTSCRDDVPPEVMKEYNACDKAIHGFFEKYGNEHGIKFVLFGDASNPKCTYSVVFSSERVLSLEAAKHLAKDTVEAYSHFLKTDPAVTTFIKRTATFKTGINYDPTLTNIGIKIGFWDKDTNRPAPPAIAQIIFSKNTFQYFQSDPNTERLTLVCEEGF